MIDYSIGSRGIKIRHDVYLYVKIHSFWIDHEKNKNDLILHTENNFLPHLIIPIRGVDPELVRMELRRHLPEKYAHKNFFDRASEYLAL
jgi:hypothetical protein